MLQELGTSQQNFLSIFHKVSAKALLKQSRNLCSPKALHLQETEIISLHNEEH